MNINRHNYEEFFLLYVDNELTEAQRVAVEAFVQQNIDLAEELALLQQSTLMPQEELSFPGKETLYKNEHSINLANYEEYFLLHVDNELNLKDKEEVEKFVLQNPGLQEEFTLIQRSKLEAEVIEFKDKATLYKKEETAKRVIALGWMRMAAAAAVIGVIATLWTTYADNSSRIEAPVAVVKKDQSKVQPVQKTGEVKEQAATQPVLEQITANENVIAGKQPAPPERKTVTKKRSEENIAAANPITKETKQEIPVVNKENRNNLPTPENNPFLAQGSGNKVDRRATPDLQADASLARNSNAGESNSHGYVQQAVYREIDTEADEEDKVLYVGGAQINKNKLRGLFKKAATFLDKTIKKPEIEKSVQIAGFEIKTK